MHGKAPFSNSLFCTSSRAATLALTIAVVFAMMIALTQPAPAQNFKVIYNFTGGLDGANPWAGLTMDRAGNFYGTTISGAAGWGTVFKLHPAGSGVLLSTLHTFQGGKDGAVPFARPIIGPDGALYGTTAYGGGTDCSGNFPGCGTVFNLKPQPTVCAYVLCPWRETVLYRFQGNEYSDGWAPYSEVSFDSEGNLYGTTSLGGNNNCGPQDGCGLVYKLAPSNGGWTENLLYAFHNGNDGAMPRSGVVLDKAGNLYGTAGGFASWGAVYELTPSGSGWLENTVYYFQYGTNGASPVGGLIFDASGNLYGTTNSGGELQGGTVFELTPSNGNWAITLLYEFTGLRDRPCEPQGSLMMDAKGNLYGTTMMCGDYFFGSVFKLTPGSGGWTYTNLYSFTGGSDGGYPMGNVVIDANGNLYGTASAGGSRCGNGTCGVIWEITP